MAFGGDAVRTLWVRVKADTKNASKGIKGTESGILALGKTAGKAAAALGAVFAVGAVADWGREVVEAGSKAEQSIGGVQAVFKGASSDVERFAAASAESVGLAASEYRDFATVTGAQLKNLLGPTDDLAQQTDRLIVLGSDLAATYGGETSDAVAAIGSLFRGEADPIERYGVSIKQADVNARLAAQGLSGLEGEAKKQAEAQARLALLFEQTTDAQGQFARESGTLAVQQQVLRASLENVKAEIGVALLPVIVDLVDTFRRDMLPVIVRDIVPALKTLLPAIVQIAKVAMPAFVASVKVVAYVLDSLAGLVDGRFAGTWRYNFSQAAYWIRRFADQATAAIDRVLRAIERVLRKVPGLSRIRLPRIGGFSEGAVPGTVVSSYGASSASPAVYSGTAAAASGGVVVNVNVSGALDPIAVGAQLADVLAQYARVTGWKAPT